MPNSCVYRLKSKDPAIEPFYIGATVNPKIKFNQHRYDCQNPKSRYYDKAMYEFIRENGGIINWELEVLEVVRVANRHEQEVLVELANLKYGALLK